MLLMQFYYLHSSLCFVEHVSKKFASSRPCAIFFSFNGHARGISRLDNWHFWLASTLCALFALCIHEMCLGGGFLKIWFAILNQYLPGILGRFWWFHGHYICDMQYSDYRVDIRYQSPFQNKSCRIWYFPIWSLNFLQNGWRSLPGSPNYELLLRVFFSKFLSV